MYLLNRHNRSCANANLVTKLFCDGGDCFQRILLCLFAGLIKGNLNAIYAALEHGVYQINDLLARDASYDSNDFSIQNFV